MSIFAESLSWSRIFFISGSKDSRNNLSSSPSANDSLSSLLFSDDVNALSNSSSRLADFAPLLRFGGSTSLEYGPRFVLAVS